MTFVGGQVKILKAADQAWSDRDAPLMRGGTPEAERPGVQGERGV